MIPPQAQSASASRCDRSLNSLGLSLRAIVLAALLATIFTLALSPLAEASKAPVGYWGTRMTGNPLPREEGFGFGAGEMASPGSVAINNTGNGDGASPGDVYLTVRGNPGTRVDQFGQFGSFVRAFGWDVVKSGEHNTGANPQQTVTVPTTATAGTFELTITTATVYAQCNTDSKIVTEVTPIRGTINVGDTIGFPTFAVPAETTITGIDGHTFTISAFSKGSNCGQSRFAATETTAPIDYNGSAAAVQSALEGLPAVGPGGATVTGGPGGSGTPFTVTFVGGQLAHNQIDPMTVVDDVTGANPSVSTVIGGGGYERCEAVSSPTDACQSAEKATDQGEAGDLGFAGPLTIDPSTGNLFVSNSERHRIEVIGSDGALQGSFGWGVATGSAQLEFCSADCQAGLTGAGAGQFAQFSSPERLAIDPTNGKLVATDGGNNRLQLFSLALNGSDEVTGVSLDRAIGWDVVASGPDDTGSGYEECNVAVNPTDVCQGGAPGTGLGQLDGVRGVAVDSTGAIYVSGFANNTDPYLQKLTPAGTSYTPTIFGGALYTQQSGTGQLGFPAIGVSDNVLFAKEFPPGASICSNGEPSFLESRILELNPTGQLLDTHSVCTGKAALPGQGTGTGIVGLNSIAVNTTTGDFYASSSRSFPANNQITGVQIFGTSEPPATSVDSVEPTTNSALIEGTINPEGPNPAYPHSLHSVYHFEFKRAVDSTWNRFGLDEDIGGGFADHTVGTRIGGLDGNTDYEVRLVGEKQGTPAGFSAPYSFMTLPVPPTIDASSSSGVTKTAADLHASINPHGTDTSYHFEYGTTSAYGTSVPAPDEGIGNSLQPQAVQYHVEGLDGHTTYHFRVVATNALGTVYSPDQTFNFFPEGCPNAQLRQQNGSDALPDCRAYELVSPEETGNVTLEAATRLPAPYASNPTRFGFLGKWGGVTGTDPTNSSFDVYVASRTNTGWQTHYTGIRGNESPFASYGAADLSFSRFLVFRYGGFQIGGKGPATPESRAPWIFDWTGESLGRWPANIASIPNGDSMIGASQPSPDFSHLAFSANNVDFDPAHEGLTSAPGSAYDYDVETGTTTLISRRANGDPIPQQPASSENVNEFIRFPGRSPFGGPGVQTLYKPAVLNPSVSTDGSHILMSTLAGPGRCDSEPCAPGLLQRLYMRVDDLATYEIAEGHDVEYQGMTADGSKVFFITKDQLATINEPQDSDQSVDLYMWEENDGNPRLVRISSGGFGTGNTDACNTEWTTNCDVKPVLAGLTSDSPIASKSGDIYFYSPELLADPNDGVEGAQNFYVYRDGSPQFVAALASNGSGNVVRIQVSPTGDHAAFITKSKLGGYDNAGKAEMYAFEPDGPEGPQCVSCIPSGKAPDWDVEGSQSGFFMSNDGRTFFATSDALIVTDTNEAGDVYEYVDGRPQLISTGTGELHRDPVNQEPVGAALAGVSADGVDVYFTTFESLVTQDRNGAALKFYDARTAGGFAQERPPPPCEAADECHGETSQPASAPSIASEGVLGAGGNSQVHRPKRGRKHRKSRRHKRRRGHHRAYVQGSAR